MTSDPTRNRVHDGSSCRCCGLPNYEGLCPHCRGDQDEYERELAPPFPSSRSEHPISAASSLSKPSPAEYAKPRTAQ